MQKKSKAILTEHMEIAPGIRSMRLMTEAAQNARPGQFVSLFCHNERRLLPRPISICEIGGNELRLVYRIAGAGTAEIATYKPGDEIELMGPLGNGFLPEEGIKKPLLVGGGVGVPPMLALAKELSARPDAPEVTMVMGYRDAHTFLSEELSACGNLIICTDDGSVGLHGTVAEAFKQEDLCPDAIFACGPKPMLAAVKTYAAQNGIPCRVSLEERMACGIGACLGCVCETTGIDAHSHVHNARVCTDGPVFWAEEVQI